MNTWILPDDQRLNRIAFSVVRSNQFLAKFWPLPWVWVSETPRLKAQLTP
jgi:hypothetical protein